MEILFNSIAVEDIFAFRHKILRPHQSISDCQYPGDDSAATKHFAAMKQEQVVGCISVYKNPQSALAIQFPEHILFQFRAMATDPSVRGIGAAKTLLNMAEKYGKEAGGTMMWCNARESAVGFYEKQGYQTFGEPYFIEGIGQHYLMYKTLGH